MAIPKLNGTTFKANQIPLAVAVQTAPMHAVMVHFDKEGYHTTDDPKIIAALRTDCAALCTEMVMEETVVLQERPRSSQAQLVK